MQKQSKQKQWGSSGVLTLCGNNFHIEFRENISFFRWISCHYNKNWKFFIWCRSPFAFESSVLLSVLISFKNEPCEAHKSTRSLLFYLIFVQCSILFCCLPVLSRHGWVVTLFDTYSQGTVFKPRYYQPWNDLGQVTNGCCVSDHPSDNKLTTCWHTLNSLWVVCG
jgi:hypothetical protein